jgi:hypothetical protein
VPRPFATTVGTTAGDRIEDCVEDRFENGSYSY